MGKKYEYTLEDCACEYCLYHDSKTQACRIETCCCLKEKAAALARLRAGKQEVQKCAA